VRLRRWGLAEAVAIPAAPVPAPGLTWIDLSENPSFISLLDDGSKVTFGTVSG
jgi:hypothetical protein